MVFRLSLFSGRKQQTVCCYQVLPCCPSLRVLLFVSTSSEQVASTYNTLCLGPCLFITTTKMSNSKEHRPSQLILGSHADVPFGRSTDGSSPREVVAARLRPLARPGPIDSSPEPSPDMVPGSTQSLQESAGIRLEPLDDTFSARASATRQFGFRQETTADHYRRERDAAMHAESLRAHSSTELIAHNSPQASRLSNLSTPALSPFTDTVTPQYTSSSTADQEHSDFYEVALGIHDTTAAAAAAAITPVHSQNTDRTYLPSSPALHGTLYRTSSVASLIPRPTVRATTNDPNRSWRTQAENTSDSLPPRPEARAATTVERMQRNVRNLLHSRHPTNNDEAGTEMDTFRRASVSHPTLFIDGAVAAQRIRERERQRVDDGLQEMVQTVQQQQQPRPTAGEGSTQQQRVPVWAWIGCLTGGLTLTAVLYGLVSKYPGSK